MSEANYCLRRGSSLLTLFTAPSDSEGGALICGCFDSLEIAVCSRVAL